MDVLFVGGTGQISLSCVELAVKAGHRVSVFNRGRQHVPLPAGDPAAQLRTLLGHAQVDAGDIEVAVADGVVTLSGAAQSWFDRDAAERLAWMLAGVHTVENRLALPPGAVEPDVEGTGQPAI